MTQIYFSKKVESLPSEESVFDARTVKDLGARSVASSIDDAPTDVFEAPDFLENTDEVPALARPRPARVVRHSSDLEAPGVGRPGLPDEVRRVLRDAHRVLAEHYLPSLRGEAEDHRSRELIWDRVGKVCRLEPVVERGSPLAARLVTLRRRYEDIAELLEVCHAPALHRELLVGGRRVGVRELLQEVFVEAGLGPVRTWLSA